MVHKNYASFFPFFDFCNSLFLDFLQFVQFIFLQFVQFIREQRKDSIAGGGSMAMCVMPSLPLFGALDENVTVPVIPRKKMTGKRGRACTWCPSGILYLTAGL